MRYFTEELVTQNRVLAAQWSEVTAQRELWHLAEEQLATAAGAVGLIGNASIMPRDAWFDVDETTVRVMRDDEGQVYMQDLMALARPVHIGKLAHLYRVSSDAGRVHRSMSGQVPTTLDKVEYDWRGAPVPIFSSAYGREWREWNTLQSENFDALADDQEAILAAVREDQADYILDGDTSITIQGYTAHGIRTSPYSKSINLGSAGGGANIDLTSADAEDIVNFLIGPFSRMLDDNLIVDRVNLYISPEIAANLDRPDTGVWVSGPGSYVTGPILNRVLANRRIAKVAVTHKLSGNEFFGFVPTQQYIRPLIGMATQVVPIQRATPIDNYQFLVLSAMGLQIRGDYNGKAGVFYSVVVN